MYVSVCVCECMRVLVHACVWSNRSQDKYLDMFVMILYHVLDNKGVKQVMIGDRPSFHFLKTF